MMDIVALSSLVSKSSDRNWNLVSKSGSRDVLLAESQSNGGD